VAPKRDIAGLNHYALLKRERFGNKIKIRRGRVAALGIWSGVAWGVAMSRGKKGIDRTELAVVYHDNPMVYEPVKMCNCNPRRKVPRWICWSEQNPGRRYYACVDAMVSSNFVAFCFSIFPLWFISFGQIGQNGAGCG
jgi:hypothetical protein